ncbi:phenylacetic acid degradation protein PaaN [Variovorax sp. PBL-E5]|uniref:phenylacetic acid degradation protein PaaN n=1 Tax=Variovorax sp. PBL-E5 TaxID=434014 RepID=UPI0013197286|nr:phenylacetic acid degradation protein PaaN [Variovorax sp. PBL-E5]VTU18590.1 Methylmalonate-semialdehyde dehydrogenase [acylating] [Variovorax sp. PBL-E5]
MSAVREASAASTLFERHRATFERAALACRERHCWSPYPELPAKYPNAAQAQADGAAAFRAHLGQRFALDQPGAVGEAGEEISPCTQQALRIRYPQADIDTLFDAAEAAIDDWAAACVDTRIGVLMEALDTIYREHLFEIAHAVMHTAGQSFNMAYAGSGVNALDRGIEALVHAKQAMDAIAPTARWERAFGSARIALDKTYRLVPRGVAVCFSCASFPTWNAWPSMLASLATGNAVIVKPHPATVLPMAISVRAFRRVLAAAGFDPNLVTLALDTSAEPIGKRLVQHPKTAIVDFTGSVAFGQWVERNAHPALVFTETAGCNTVVLESADDLDAALRSLATTLCMFSAQMCTSPQNIYVPAQGVRTPQGVVAFDAVARRLADAVAALTGDAKKAAMILATLQSPQTLALLAQMTEEGEQRGQVLLRPKRYLHPEYPDARTSTPLMLKVGKAERDLYGAERFGPISFVIACDDAADALAQAVRDVKQFGGLTAFLYSTDETCIASAEAAYAKAGAQLTINLTGPMPLNFAAAYSDYHVTGLNPAGNASLTDLAFVAGRFRISQSRRPAAPDTSST